MRGAGPRFCRCAALQAHAPAAGRLAYVVVLKPCSVKPFSRPPSPNTQFADRQHTHLLLADFGISLSLREERAVTRAGGALSS